MAVFGNYARYYNLLYKDKDYAREAAFVLDILMKHGAKPNNLLDLGCGTGRHAMEIYKAGISVTGVDMSETMLEVGRVQLSMCEQKCRTQLPQLLQGDVRTVRLDQKFDAVTSLFHVMSYQNTEEDTLAMLATAKAHLLRGGVFLFDFWYGPGVLTEPPTERDKRLEDENTVVARHARPVHNVNDNIVEVHYDIQIKDKTTGLEETLTEIHPMRYWFMPELRWLAKQAGFTVVGEGAWLTTDLPQKNTWSAWMCLKLS